MLCKKCGAQLPDGTEKCEFCGADLIEEQPEEEITETQEEIEEEILDENEIKRREQMQKMMEEKQLQLSEIEKRRNSKKRRQQQTKIAIVCAICLACIAAVGFGSYAIKENAKKPKSTPVAVVTTAPSVMPVTTPAATINTVTPVPLGSTAPIEEAKNSSWKASDAGNSASNNASAGTSNGGRTNAAQSNSSGGSSNAASGSSKSNNTSSKTSNSSKTSSSGTSASNNSSSSNVKSSGAATDKITSELTKGGEVLYNNDTGKHLMTFTMNNTLYYANVSEGSTTEQIKDKNITISAYPTGEKYKGNTIYEITKMTYYENAASSDYVIPNSGTKLLTNDDIKGLSKEQLAIARNEIYARHGRKFQMAEYRNYFSKKSWYKENPNYNYSNENSNLNDIESKNVVFLLSAESRR